MKKLILGFIILISINLQSQNLPNKFQIGDYVEVMENDSILVYFNCTGTIVNKKCAQYYRKGKIDSININLSGDFIDYFINGKIALKASIINDFLNGKATYFYKNGTIKSVGNYYQDIKTGVWTYYYKNGHIEKIINFVKGYPLIANSYKNNGKQLIENGNGKYKGKFHSYKSCDPLIIWGPIKNGKMDGKWTLYNSDFNKTIGYEFYEDGIFIKGDSYGFIYTDYQKININGFCANENLHLDGNTLGCPGDRFSWLEYKDKNLKEVFYPNLIDSIENLQYTKLKNQWLIIGLRINKNNKLDKVNIKSSINDELIESETSRFISSMNNFKAAKINGKNIDFDLFFSVLIRDNHIIIPKEYIYRNNRIFKN